MLALEHNVAMPLKKLTSWLAGRLRRHPNQSAVEAAIVFTVVEVVLQSSTSPYDMVTRNRKVAQVEQLMHVRSHENTISDVVLSTLCYGPNVSSLKHR